MAHGEMKRIDYCDARICKNCAHATVNVFGHTVGYMCKLDNKRCCKTKTCSNHAFEWEGKLTPEQIASIKSEEDDYIVNRLVLVHMCMCFCSNIMNEVVEAVKAQGRFRYGLKNTLKNVQREVKEMMGNFFNKIDADATDEYVENYERFEEMLRVMARLKDLDESKLTKPRETQFTEFWYNEKKMMRPPLVSEIIDWADTH